MGWRTGPSRSDTTDSVRTVTAARHSTQPDPQRAARVGARLTWGVIGGPAATAEELDLVRRGLGGVVLFSRNVQTPEQVAELIAELRAAAPRHLHVAVDQEGGHVVRLRDPLTRFPSAMGLAATGDPRLAARAAAASGRELAALGIDVVCAPDLDLAAAPNNPTLGARTFGDDPAVVGRFGAAMVRGFLAGGVLPMPKHFPGHGRTSADSHVGVAVVAGDLDELRASDLPPYRAAIEAGTPAVMVGHVSYAAAGDGRPATLSPRLLGGLLRDELRFGGVVVSDALVMDAFAVGRAIPDAAVEALRAGVDVLMALDPAPAVAAAVERALRDGRLDPRAILRTVRRLDRYATLARRRLARAGTPGDERLARHRALAEEGARRSLTLVGDGSLLPLDPRASILVVDVASAAVSPVEDAAVATDTGDSALGATLRARLPRAGTIRVIRGDAEAAARALRLAASADVVVLATHDAFADAHEHAFVTSMLDLGRPVLHVALHSPVDLVIGRPTDAVAAYADIPPTRRALADALVRGPQAFPGQLPMRLPAAILPVPEEESAA